MTDTFWIILGVVVIAAVVLWTFRGRLGSVTVSLFGSSVSANQSKGTASIENVSARRDVKAHVTEGGDAKVTGAEAGRDVTASSGKP
jgi:hypothetical protein